MEMTDILIIGSGPAGLSAGIYGVRAGMKVVIAEKNYMGTGQIVYSHRVDNYLGMIGTNGYDLGEKFRNDAISLGVQFFNGELTSISKNEDEFVASFANGESIISKAVIIATGASNRHLGAENEEPLIGAGVSFCAVCDGAFYRNRVAAVVGGGDTALDDALYLSDIAKKVYLIHRRDEFRGSKKTLDELKSRENVEIITNATVKKIVGDDMVEGVILNIRNTIQIESETAAEIKAEIEAEKEIAVNGVFVAAGMIPNTEVIRGMVDLDSTGYVIADETGVTNVGGLFVAGDVREKMLRQVVTAVSDGACAATSAVAYLRSKI